MGTFLQAEVLQFVPRLSVTRDNENILRRATFTELKFNATTVKIMRPFIDIYKIVILVAGCFFFPAFNSSMRKLEALLSRLNIL